MSLVNKSNELKDGKQTDEAYHQNTKVRALEGMGSRKARLTVKEAKRMVEKMMDEKDPAPNPRTPTDRVKLAESARMMDETMKKLKEVKETKKKKKYESLSISQSDAGKILKKLEKPFEALMKELRSAIRDKKMNDEFSDEMESLDNALEDFSADVLARLEMAKNGE